MTKSALRSNPEFLSDEELISSFCVRKHELFFVIRGLRECTGRSNGHQIVIGPRGSGKTTLLLRVAAEIRRDNDLSRRFFPIMLAEERYEASTIGEFWLECVSRLNDEVLLLPGKPELKRSCEELRRISDDRDLEDLCLDALFDFADRESKRLVLFVENLDIMFREFDDRDAGWRLRYTLQMDYQIILIAGASALFDEIIHPNYACYHFFRVEHLRPLDSKECATLWQKESGEDCPPETIEAMRILTDGNPRLLAVAARCGANQPFRGLMANLLDLIDDQTEYFKYYINALPLQERRVFLALATLWKPATTREIADRARLDTNRCSAQLARLVNRGVVQVVGGSMRRLQYYLAERLYYLYYLMRRSRGKSFPVEALIQFMEAYYSSSKSKGSAIQRESKSMDLNSQIEQMHQILFEQPQESSVVPTQREELSGFVSRETPSTSDDPGITKALRNKADLIASESSESDAMSQESSEIDCLEHLTRARTYLAISDETACAAEIETALLTLSEFGALSREILDDLCWLAVELGPAKLRESITASPASDRLLPLTAALQMELGLETRVAKEVEEVAEDIRKNLEERKKKKHLDGE